MYKSVIILNDGKATTRASLVSLTLKDYRNLILDAGIKPTGYLCRLPSSLSNNALESFKAFALSLNLVFDESKDAFINAENAIENGNVALKNALELFSNDNYIVVYAYTEEYSYSNSSIFFEVYPSTLSFLSACSKQKDDLLETNYKNIALSSALQVRDSRENIA